MTSSMLDDYALFCAAHRIADIIHDDRARRGLWMEDRRGESVNGFYNHTSSGLFLEMYYGLPSTLWTPWGKWGFGGSGIGGEEGQTLAFLVAHFGVVEHLALKVTGMGCFGPVFALYRVDDVALPTADMASPVKDWHGHYERCTAAWEALKQRRIRCDKCLQDRIDEV